MTGGPRVMSDDRPAAFRMTGPLIGLLATALAGVFWTITSWSGAWAPPMLGWALVPVAPGLAGYACWRASRASLAAPARRFWRQLTVTCLLIGVATVSNTHDALFGPGSPTQHTGGRTLALYLSALLTVLWALLRLPAGFGRHGNVWLRFGLDAGTLVITASVFAWYLSFRHIDAWTQSVGSTVPVVALVLLGVVAMLAFTKVAVAGYGALDRRSLHLLAAAACVGATGGAFAPLMTDRPQLNNAQIVVPLVMAVVALGADRQRRAAALPAPPAPRRRPFSPVPYAAVAATDVLLLAVSHDAGPATLAVAAAAVALTVLVVVRQFAALQENVGLLRRVDANLVELERYQEELTHRATRDTLTGLPNRMLFEERCQEELAAAGPHGAVSLALIDVDDFKAVNDRLGHAVGDLLLVAVAHRLRGCVRAGDTVARLGGDEFALLLRDAGEATAVEVLDRVARALGQPLQAAGHDLLVRASIGLADAWPGAGPQELLRRADLAMYAAKERGKGRWVRYDAELEQHQAADAQLGADLRLALDRGEFHLLYQPIVRLPDGAWQGVETLVRWRHPRGEVVRPDVFIAVAERTGLIVPLGDWIMRTACRQAADWLARYGDAAPAEVGVNVSARQLRDPNFALDVQSALRDAGLPAERLMVEVTETAVFDGGVALDTLSAVAQLGVRVALDDFGTGHSSLGLLRTCPADTLKVDKSFVDGIGGASEEAVIATAMIQITDGLKLQAIAEGVETAEQAQILYRLGYRFAQGYHFARPLSPEQVDEHLRAAGRSAA